MSSPLFREEVIQARQAQYLGAIRLGRNPSLAAMAWIAMALVGALVAFASWAQVARKTTLPGLLVPALGTIDVNVPVAGVLAEMRVSEGQQVESGQVLFVVNTDRGTPQGPTAALVTATLQQRLLALEAEQAAGESQKRQRRDALLDRIRRLDFERDSIGQEAELAQRRVMLAQRNFERIQELAREGFVSESHASDKQDEWMDLQARAESARRSVAAVRREQQSLRAELDGLEAGWSADQARMFRAAATLRQEAIENEGRKTVAVLAPKAGLIASTPILPGAVVMSGQNLATLLPSSAGASEELTFEAHLYSPSHAIGLVRRGQQVQLRLSAFPHQTFGSVPGVITSVGRSPTSPRDLPSGQADVLLRATRSVGPLFRIVVSPATQALQRRGESFSFRPGMALEASVVVDQGSIWELVFHRSVDFIGKESP